MENQPCPCFTPTDEDLARLEADVRAKREKNIPNIITLEGRISYEAGGCRDPYCERCPKIFIGDQSLTEILEGRKGQWLHVQIVVEGKTAYASLASRTGDSPVAQSEDA